MESGSIYISEKTIYILRKWRARLGKDATRKCIIEALRNCGQGENADHLDDIFRKERKRSEEMLL